MLSNAGQACVAGSRLIVEECIAAPLAEAIVTRMEAAKPGPTWDETSEYSPIISKRQLNRIHGIVEAAVEAGGECLFGGAQMDAPGYFYQPTLMAVRDSSSPAITEEIFGPVLTMQTFADEEEALALADHPTYGLAAGLFTRDLSRALGLTRRPRPEPSGSTATAALATTSCRPAATSAPASARILAARLTTPTARARACSSASREKQ